MSVRTLVADWASLVTEDLDLAEDADEKARLQPIIDNKRSASQNEPIHLDEDFLVSDDLFDLTHEAWSRYDLWLYQNALYGVSRGYTEKQGKLLVLGSADSGRQKFERLSAKFSKEQSEHIKHERTRIPENVRIEVWRRDQGKCAGCGSRVNLEYDHIVPVSRGGSNTARNVELLCEACNRSKGDRIQRRQRRGGITVTIVLDLAPEMEAYLRERAEQEGQAAEAVAHALLTQAIQADAQGHHGVLLQDYGINPAQAAEIKASLASFAEEWSQPGMDVYDDYDAAKLRLQAR